MKSLNLVLGRYDDPENQIQDDYVIDLYSSNIAIFGVAMSGKTTLLKTLIVRIHQMPKLKTMEEIYILDFNNGLQLYGELPYVKACFDGTNDENVRRIFKIIEEKFSEYSKKLSGKVYSQCLMEEKPPHITFILDGLNSFFMDGKYETYKEILLKLARDGLAKGITIVFAANELTGGITKMMGAFNRIVAFDLPKDKYSDLFSTKVEKPILVKGRGIANIDTDAFEFQAYYPYNFEDSDEEESLEKLRQNMKEFYDVDLEKANAERLKTFTSDLDAETWEKYIGNQLEYPAYKQEYLTIGLDYFKFMPISIKLRDANVIAIYGKKRSGKSNLLRLILYGALGIPGVRFVFWEDKRNGLNDIMDVMKQDIIETFPQIGSRAESPNYPSWKLIEKKEEFFEFIKNQGYYDVPDNIHIEQEDSDKFIKRKNPFTIFVIQSKTFYLTAQGGVGVQNIIRLASFMGSASDENVLFVFSDVQNIAELEVRTYFNNNVKYAFLFDDIVRFIRDNKGQHTVFGTQDPEELKELFGKCESGDGYLFDVEQSDEVVKFKMLNVSYEKMLRDEQIENEQLWKKYRILERIKKLDYSGKELDNSKTEDNRKSELEKPNEKQLENELESELQDELDDESKDLESQLYEEDDDEQILPIHFRKLEDMM